MADRPAELNVDVDVPQANQQQNRNGDARAQAQNNTQFGVVRDRLFHAMLVKVALSYSSHVSMFWRRIIEFISLLIAYKIVGIDDNVYAEDMLQLDRFLIFESDAEDLLKTKERPRRNR